MHIGTVIDMMPWLMNIASVVHNVQKLGGATSQIISEITSENTSEIISEVMSEFGDNLWSDFCSDVQKNLDRLTYHTCPQSVFSEASFSILSTWDILKLVFLFCDGGDEHDEERSAMTKIIIMLLVLYFWVCWEIVVGSSDKLICPGPCTTKLL